MQEQINDSLKWRYATKQFDKTKKVNDSDIESILNAGALAPTAYGLQPFSIIHVKDEDIRNKIKTEAAFGQNQVTDASDFFVIAFNTKVDEEFVGDYIQRISKTRNIALSDLKEFQDTMNGDIVSRDQISKNTWAGRQAYISLGFMLETAALLRVDACPMEGFIPSKVDEILNLKEMNLESVGFLAIGYRKTDDLYASLAKVRRPIDSLVISI